MKKIFIGIGVLLVLGGLAYYFMQTGPVPNQKLYVASEADGKVTVIDTATKKIIRELNLGVEHDAGILQYNPHNVQVAPDGKSVWVTANVGSHKHASSRVVNEAYAHEGDTSLAMADQLIVIDPYTDRIEKRIDIGQGIQLAHVVLTPDSKTAYVTAQQEGVVYRINAETFSIEKEITLTKAGEPHGMRISPDGKTAYIAMMGSKSLVILDLATENFTEVPLGGPAVQTAVTPDGNIAAVSIYEKNEIGLYDIAKKTLKKVALPKDAKGPIQIYPSPDSKFMYVADQGYYFAKPQGNMFYTIDIAAGKVSASLALDAAPHGVAVTRDGKLAYVTNLLGNNVSIVDLTSNTELGRIPVGREPNGISIWDNPTPIAK